jgi:hypothetical protein
MKRITLTNLLAVALLAAGLTAFAADSTAPIAHELDNEPNPFTDSGVRICRPTRPATGLTPDCCYFTQRHFVDRMLDGKSFETNGEDYHKTLAVQEAVYRSVEVHAPVTV